MKDTSHHPLMVAGIDSLQLLFRYPSESYLLALAKVYDPVEGMGTDVFLDINKIDLFRLGKEYFLNRFAAHRPVIPLGLRRNAHGNTPLLKPSWPCGISLRQVSPAVSNK
jgi:hypothetical protein